MRKRAIAISSILLLLVVLTGQVHAVLPQCALVPGPIAQQISDSEPWYCPINNQIYAQWANDLPLAAAAILVSFSIAALIIMLGVALKNDRIRNFGMGELYEAIASAIIVGMFLYVCAVLFGIIPAFFVGNINPYPVALNLMTNTTQQAEGLYSAYLGQYMPAKFLSSVKLTLTTVTPDPALNVNIDAQFTALGDLVLEILYIAPLSTLGWIISDGVTVLWAEYYMLVFFAAAAIPVFLVPGVVLRSIFPTRSLGGMLIALAIGFYLVMPSLFAVAYYFTAPGISQAVQTATAQATRFAVSGSTVSSITPTSPIVLQLQDALQNTQSAMSGFWLLILFYPVLIISMTYAFVTQVAQFIGSSARTGGKLRQFI